MANELIDQLFRRLFVLYGAKKVMDQWQGVDPEEVKAEWARQLSGFTVRQIDYALELVAKPDMEVRNARNPAFPPTLPEFLHLCIQAQRVVPKEPYLRIEGKGKYDPNRPDIVEARERCMATANALGMRKLLDGVPE